MGYGEVVDEMAARYFDMYAAAQLDAGSAFKKDDLVLSAYAAFSLASKLHGCGKWSAMVRARHPHKLVLTSSVFSL